MPPRMRRGLVLREGGARTAEPRPKTKALGRLCVVAPQEMSLVVESSVMRLLMGCWATTRLVLQAWPVFSSWMRSPAS